MGRLHRIVNRGKPLLEGHGAQGPPGIAAGGHRQAGRQTEHQPGAAHLRDRGHVAPGPGAQRLEGVAALTGERTVGAHAIAEEHAAAALIGDRLEHLEIGADRLHDGAARRHRPGNLDQLAMLGEGARNRPAIGQRVRRETVGRKADRAPVDRFGHNRRHLTTLGVGGLLLDRALTHDVKAHRAVADQAGDIDAGADALDRVEIAAVAFPVPGQTAEDRLTGDVLDRFHHAGEQLLVAGPTGREGHAAIAQQRSGHAMPADRRAARIPADLGIEMGMDVDEARRHMQAVGVDFAPGAAADLADFGDQATVDGHVAGKGLAAAAVNNLAATNHDVMCHRKSPLQSLLSSLNQPCQLARKSLCQSTPAGMPWHPQAGEFDTRPRSARYARCFPTP